MKKREGFSDIGLRYLSVEVERIITAGGIPSGSMSDFTTENAQCKVHAQCVRTNLRLPGSLRVDVVHCGCDHWLQPVAAPPADIAEMARGLAEEILWYWHERERAVEMMREVRGAFEREINRGTDEGLDWSLGRMELARFETFRGRRKRAQVAFDLMHSNLWPYAMDWPFETPAAVSKYFRSARPHQRALAARRDQLASVGATGAIDRVAVAAISQARLDPLGVIALATRSTDRLILKLGWTELSLRWRVGTIEGTLDLAPGIEWEFGRIRFAPDCAPEENMLTHRKPIGMFLASPFVNGDLIVSGAATDSKGCTTLIIKPELDFFNINDGAATWVDVHVSALGSLTVADDRDLQYDLELPSMVGREAKKKVRR